MRKTGSKFCFNIVFIKPTIDRLTTFIFIKIKLVILPLKLYKKACTCIPPWTYDTCLFQGDFLMELLIVKMLRKREF